MADRIEQGINRADRSVKISAEQMILPLPVFRFAYIKGAVSENRPRAVRVFGLLYSRFFLFLGGLKAGLYRKWPLCIEVRAGAPTEIEIVDLDNLRPKHL